MTPSPTRLSVIIPLYNAAAHLSRLESTLAQQGVLEPEAGAEIVLVDDKSTDATAALVREMMSRHSNIIYLEGQGEGQGSARNLGLDKARGEYIYMMDQDDVLTPGTLLPHLRLIEQTQADVVRFGFDTPQPAEAAGLLVSPPHPDRPLTTRTLTGKGHILDTCGLHNATPVWTTIFSRRYAADRGIRFDPEVRFYEDLIFMWRLLLPAAKVVVTDCVGYHWIQYPDSDMHTTTRSHKVRRRLTLPALVRDLRALIDPAPATPTDRRVNGWLEQKADWYEFAYWSMVLSLRALGRSEALRELERHRAARLYPLATPYPDLPSQYPANFGVKLRRRLINSPVLLKFAINLLLK